MATKRNPRLSSSRGTKLKHAGIDYAESVISGKRVACKWVILACKRFFKDLKRKDIYLDIEAADKVIDLTETFRHYKGEFAGKHLKLEPFQKFIILNIFGFKRKIDGKRRFKYAHLEVPRKNGKTIFAAAIALYMLCADDEVGAEVYNAATKMAQAMILHKDARTLILKSRDEDFIDAFHILRNPALIEYEGTDSFMRPLGRDTGGETTDGLNPHAIIADETHAWADPEFWNVLNSALGARSQPLFVMITTAGHNLNSVGRTHSKITERILEGKDGGEGDDYFGMIYGVDEGDLVDSPTSWEKANPLYGITVNARKFRSQLALANANPSMMNELKTKWLNIWLNTADSWISSERWNKCSHGTDPKHLLGMRCYGGLDLAVTRDLSALVLVFPPQEGLERWTCLSRFWCPSEDIRNRSKRDKVPYQTWAEHGFIFPTPGEVMDHGYIVNQIIKDSEDYQIVSIGYDRAYSIGMIQPLIDEGINMVSFSQGILSISPYAKELERLIIEGENFEHFDHPVLAWNAGNAVVKTDANGNIKPDKSKSEERIDGVVALIMGLGVAIESEFADDGEEFYSTVAG